MTTIHALLVTLAKIRRLLNGYMPICKARAFVAGLRPHDMRIGDGIRPRIDESIRVHDKLLLVLSEFSLASTWVKKEVETAFEQEAQQNKLISFPIGGSDGDAHSRGMGR